MLGFNLAHLYEVETKRLKEAVRRNPKRFSPDFMFELTAAECPKIPAFCFYRAQCTHVSQYCKR